MLNWIDRIPTPTLVFAAVLLGLTPFVPEPHIWQKLKMLANGELHRPLDIFDLFMHSAPTLLLVIKLARRGKTGPSDD